MELLEVRRVQEEGEKKRQALPTESLLVDGATQQRSEEFHQYHSPDSKQNRQIINVNDFILTLISLSIVILSTLFLYYWNHLCVSVSVCAHVSVSLHLCVCLCVCRDGNVGSQNEPASDQDSPRVSYRSPAYQKYSNTLQRSRTTSTP